MAVQYTCTKAKLKDPQKARALNEKYVLWGIDVKVLEDASGAFLELIGNDEDSDSFPDAALWDEWPLPDDDDAGSEEEVWEAQFALMLETGSERFLEYLVELAACLETDLLILGLSMATPFAGAFAVAWLVRPGATSIVVLDAVV